MPRRKRGQGHGHRAKNHWRAEKAQELRRLAAEENSKKDLPDGVDGRLASENDIEDMLDIEAMDTEENNNDKVNEKNLSNLHKVDDIVESPDNEKEQPEFEEDWSDYVIVNGEESSENSDTESQATKDRIMKILADYRQEMGYTVDNMLNSSLNKENESEVTEQDRLEKGHNSGQSTELASTESVNPTVQANIEPHSCTKSASMESLSLTEPANVEPVSPTEPPHVESQCPTQLPSIEPLNLTCQDEVLDIKPVTNNSTAQSNEDSMNLICQDDTPEEKSFKYLNEYIVIKGGDENYDAVKMYANLIDACRHLTNDKFTFVKNIDIVRFIELSDTDIPKIKLAVSVTRDFIVNVTVNGKLLPRDHALWLQVPNVCLNVEHVKNLLKTLSTYQVCIGNPDEELQNVMHFMERSEEESEQKYKGYRDEFSGSTIRSQNCPLLIFRKYERCKNCQKYRRCLKRQLQRKNAKSAPSTTNWLKSTMGNSLLLESEKIEKLKQMREHIAQLETKLEGLTRKNKKLAKIAEQHSHNNKKNKYTTTENAYLFNLHLRADIGPKLVKTNIEERSSFPQQSVHEPMNISTASPNSEDTCSVTVKTERTNKNDDIIGVFKSESGVSKPVIIKIMNDKPKSLSTSCTTSNVNIADIDEASGVQNDRRVDKSIDGIDLVLTESVDKLDHIESPLAVKQVESKPVKLKSDKLKSNQGQICKICGKVVKCMRFHMIIHKPKRFKCVVCEKCFHRKDALEKHAVIHTGVKAHRCPICGQFFSLLSNMIRHTKRKHTNLRPHKCSYCQKGFSTNYDRREHEEVRHSDIMAYGCKICYKTFKCRSYLRNHQSKHHEQLNINDPNAEQHVHVCDQCGKSYKSKLSLNSHKYLHKKEEKGEKQLSCDKCEMKFYWPSLLYHHKQKKHLRHDERSKNYICHICGKHFYDQQAVRQHQLVHSEARPYKCSHCPASFKRPAHLRSHENSHNSVKPYQCKTCHKWFSQKYDMETHELNVHQGKRDFVCMICSKAFVRENHLRSHMKIHGGDQFYKCNQCNKSFIRLSALEKHEQTHSTEDTAAEQANLNVYT